MQPRTPSGGPENRCSIFPINSGKGGDRVHAKFTDSSEMGKGRGQFQKEDVVLMRDDFLPKNQWPLVIITETLESSDGLLSTVFNLKKVPFLSVHALKFESYLNLIKVRI